MRRVLFTAWIISVVLGAFAPIAPKVLSIDRPHYFVVGAGVVVMIITMVSLKRLGKGAILAISMSASGLTLGAAIGFALLAVVSNGASFPFLAGKWLLIACLLSLFFWRDLNADDLGAKPEFPKSNLTFPENFAELTDEQKLEFKEKLDRKTEQMKVYGDKMKEHNRRRFMTTLPILLIGVAAVLWTTFANRSS